jgi:hypothetical protein
MQRPGPQPQPDDSWDSAPTSLNDTLPRHRSTRRYLRVAVILIVTALVPTVAIPMLLSDDQHDTDRDPAAYGAPSRGQAPSAVETTDVGVDVTASGSLPSGSPADRPPPAAQPPAPPKLPLVFEAEASTVRLRRAEVIQVDGASGGQAARFTATNGEVRIDGLAVPSTGTYKITIAYAPGGAWSGDLRAFDGPVAIDFESGTGCCLTLTANVTLMVTGSLHIGVSRGDGAFPAIDRIVIDSK